MPQDPPTFTSASDLRQSSVARNFPNLGTERGGGGGWELFRIKIHSPPSRDVIKEPSLVSSCFFPLIRPQEAVRRLFQQQLQQASNVDELSTWCNHTLRTMKTGDIDSEYPTPPLTAAHVSTRPQAPARRCCSGWDCLTWSHGEPSSSKLLSELLSSKNTVSQPSKGKRVSDVVRNCSMILLVRLQEKFEFDHSFRPFWGCLYGKVTLANDCFPAVPTFIAFLKDVQSPYEVSFCLCGPWTWKVFLLSLPFPASPFLPSPPYPARPMRMWLHRVIDVFTRQVHDYVKQYLGDSSETREFAREFIERRKNQKPSRTSPVSFPQVSGLHDLSSGIAWPVEGDCVTCSPRDFLLPIPHRRAFGAVWRHRMFWTPGPAAWRIPTARMLSKNKRDWRKVTNRDPRETGGGARKSECRKSTLASSVSALMRPREWTWAKFKLSRIHEHCSRDFRHFSRKYSRRRADGIDVSW